MREDYYEVYSDMFEVYGHPGFQRYDYEIRLIRRIKETINQAISHLGLSEKVRPDAKLLLLVNFHQLVVLPLIHPSLSRDIYQGGHIPIDSGKILELVTEDALTILTFAQKKNENKKEISSGDILKSITALWSKLGVNGVEVWGD